MRWVVLVSAFAILWFLALQVVLPIGIKTFEEGTESGVVGEAPGDSAQPRLRLKFTVATLAAAAIWLVFYGLVLAHVVNL